MRPLPLLTPRSRQALAERPHPEIAPVEQVLRALDTDAIAGSVDQDVLIGLAVDEHTGILASRNLVVVGPRLEVVGVRHPRTALLEEAPPLKRVVLVRHKAGVDHATHLADGDLGTFDTQQLWLAPLFQIIAGHLEDARVLVSYRLIYRRGVGCRAEQPLVAIANDIAGTAVVEIEVLWRKWLRLGPSDEIGALRHGKLTVVALPRFSPHVAVEHSKDALVVVPGWIPMADVAIAPQKDGMRNGVPVNSSLGGLGFCLRHRCSP